MFEILDRKMSTAIPAIFCILVLAVIAIPASANGLLYTQDIIADGPESATDVGDLTVVDNGDGTISITFTTTGNWYMTETHLAVVSDPSGFPTTGKYNPKVGQFTIFGESGEMEFDPSVQTYTYGPITVNPGTIYIAAHADIQDPTTLVDTDGDTIPDSPWQETAWAGYNGDGISFGGKNWAVYLVIEVPDNG